MGRDSAREQSLIVRRMSRLYGPSMRIWRGVIAGFGGSVAVALLAAAAFAAAAPREDVPTGFRAYLDAADVPVLLATTPAAEAGGGLITATTATSGYLKGVSGIPSDVLVGAVASAADGLAGAGQIEVIRSMSASIRDDGSTASTFGASLVNDDGVFTVAQITSSGVALWYSPPLLELPAELAVGATWSATGLVNQIADYEYSGRIEESDEPDCIVTATTTRITLEGSDPILSRLRNTWCIGRGSTFSVDVDSGRAVSVTDSSVPNPTDASPPRTPLYREPLALPFLSPDVVQRALLVGDDLVVVNSSTQDVIAVPLSPPVIEMGERASTLSIAWMQHPGGAVLGAASDGQNLYLTSASRRVTSLNRAGGLRWSVTTSDVASGSPVLLDRVVVFATLDGSVVALDRATGRVRWTQTMSDAVVVSPVALGNIVVVADIAGRVVALDGEGAQAWAASAAAVTSPMSAINDAVLVGDTAGDAYLFSHDGAQIWSVGIAGPISGTAEVAGGVIVVPTKNGLQGLDLGTGESRWFTAEWPFASVAVVDDAVWATQRDRVATFDPGGLVSVVATGLVEPDGDPVRATQIVPGPYLITSHGALLPWPGGS